MTEKYKISLEQSVRGPRVLVCPEGEDPRTSESTGFFEILLNGEADCKESLLFDMQNTLPHSQKGKALLVDPDLLAELLAAYAKNKL